MRLRIDYIFDDVESRVSGLQGIELPKGSCALFVYEFASMPRYHMANVSTDLWLSSIVGGECVESAHMVRGSGEIYALSRKTRCTVESRREIPVGSSVDVRGGYLVVM